MAENRLQKKIITGLLFAIVLLAVAGINYAIGVDGPKVHELSLQQAVDLALKNNPDMEIAELAVQKAEKQYKGAKYSADSIETEDVHTYEAGLLKWVNPKAAEVGLTLAKKSRELSENGLKVSVETAYYDVLKAERNLKIKRENLKYLQDQLKIAQTAYKIGTKAKVDVSVIEAAVAAAQAAATSEENTYRVAVMELNRLTGLDLDTPLKLTTQFTVEKISGTVNLEETIKEVLADNYSILSVKSDLEVKKVQQDVAKKFYGPGVTVHDTAEIDAKIAEATVRRQELALTAVVRESYLSLFTLEQMIDWQTKEVEKTRENARVFALKYQAGLATSLDVKKATIDLEQAESDLADTIYNYNLLKSRFKYDLFTATDRTSGAGY